MLSLSLPQRVQQHRNRIAKEKNNNNVSHCLTVFFYIKASVPNLCSDKQMFLYFHNIDVTRWHRLITVFVSERHAAKHLKFFG